MTEIRALTIRQPWADAIAHGEKRTENRSRRTNYTGKVLIHAGLTGDREAVVIAGVWPGPDVRGAVIAVADLVGCHQAAKGCCAPWGFEDCWHWVLSDVRPLPRPIPAKGRLGLWIPDADLLAAVEAQYTEMEVAW